MKDFRKILVPVDFSECSMAALEHAAVWAERFGAALDIVHVWEAPSFTPQAPFGDATIADAAYIESVRARAEESMEAFANEARARGVRVHAAWCTPGSPALRIVEIAGDGGYDLIVLGTHGRTGLKHLLLGSVAERVVRLAPCPVVTVRSAALPSSARSAPRSSGAG